MATTMAITADQLSALSLIGDLRPADIVALRSFIQDRRSSASADPGLTGSEDEVLAFAQQAARASIGNQLATERARIQTEDTNLATEVAAGSISGPKPFPTYLAGLKCASAQLSALKLLEVVDTRLQELRVIASGLESEMETQPGHAEHADGDDDFRRLRTLRIHLQASSSALSEFLGGLAPKLSKDYALAEAKYYFGLSGSAFLLSKIQAQDHLISEGSLEEGSKKTPKALLEQHRTELVKAAKEEQKEASNAAVIAKGVAAGVQQVKSDRGGRTGNQRSQHQQQQQQQQQQKQQQQQQQQEISGEEPPKKKPRKRGKRGQN